MYVSRYLYNGITWALQHVPVTIVHGARAIGKTSLLNQLQADGHVATRVSLADDDQLSKASNDPLAWLTSLPQPIAIDDAHLLDQLPGALKQFLGETSNDIQIILTGSAAIRQASLGVYDPFAPRCYEVELQPLCEAELRDDQPWSLLHCLAFEDPQSSTANDSRPWQDWLPHGGLPPYRVAGRSLAEAITTAQAQLRTMLTDSMLSDETYSTTVAYDVLNYVLRHPAAELDINAAARALDLNARSVSHSLDLLQRHFVSYDVPNISRPPNRIAHAATKLYPSDVLLSAAAMYEPTFDLTQNGLVESWVMQQLRAHSGWSDPNFSISYYRDNSDTNPTTVDIVVQAPGGTLVGIDVKIASDVQPRHARSLRTLKERYAQNWRCGYIVYTGSSVEQIDDDIWAIPLHTLYQRAAWTTTTPDPANPERTKHAAAVIRPSPTGAHLTLVPLTHPDEAAATYMGDPAGFLQKLTETLAGMYGISAEISNEPPAVAPTADRIVTIRLITPLMMRDPQTTPLGTTLDFLWIADPHNTMTPTTGYCDISQALLCEPDSSPYVDCLHRAARYIAETL